MFLSRSPYIVLLSYVMFVYLTIYLVILYVIVSKKKLWWMEWIWLSYLIWYLYATPTISFFWSIPHRFFRDAIAWQQLNFIFKVTQKQCPKFWNKMLDLAHAGNHSFTTLGQSGIPWLLQANRLSDCQDMYLKNRSLKDFHFFWGTSW